VIGHGLGPEQEYLGDSYILLVGGGEANLSGRVLPYVSPASKPKALPGTPLPDPLRALEAMADQVAATGLKVLRGDVWGDDTLFPWEPYPSDWAVDDLVWGYGAPVSALTVEDNQLALTVVSGTKVGDPLQMELEQAVPYYKTELSGRTAAAKESRASLQIERAVGSRDLRIFGEVPLGESDKEEIAIDDPAEYAARVFKALLEARGIMVKGTARALHRETNESMAFLTQAKEPMPVDQNSLEHAIRSFVDCMNWECNLRHHVGETLAIHRSEPLVEDVIVTNKTSQNLHAELMLRHLGTEFGDTGSTAQGARVVRSWLTTSVGLDKDDFVFYDGSGLSGHDLVTPRATAKLLSYAAHDPKMGLPQSWFADWKASLPVGGVDGSLGGRFAKPPLAGHVFAKTGTLGEARALSGYLECASGKTVIFSIMDTSHMPGSADRDVMDRIVAAVQAAQ
jgi:D-alanyl-D-alanine carboxypeptidase/D-alanyl-D-alanine-endopeptidase (penicillin-binding protein 4)